MATTLPDAGEQSSGDHMQISRMFVEQARTKLADGDRLQASDAMDQGWQHSHHEQLIQTAIQLGNEFDCPDLGH